MSEEGKRLTLGVPAAVAPRIRSLARIAIGGVMLQYGTAKLFAFPASISGGAPLPPLILVSGYLEFIFGLILALGFGTRIAALILSVEMAIAYVTFHAPKGAWPILNGGNLPIVLSFALLIIAAEGGGPWGLDGLRRR